jgi:hypothetical protein
MNYGIKVLLALLLVSAIDRAAIAESQPPLPVPSAAIAFPVAGAKAIVIQDTTVSLAEPHKTVRPLASAPRSVGSAVLLGTTHVLAVERFGLSYDLYSIADDRWEALPEPPSGGHELEYLIALDDHRVLAGTSSFGSRLPRTVLKHAFIFDIRTRQWRRTADSNRDWYDTDVQPGARLSDGRILMAQSWFVEVFDPVAEAWTLLSTNSTPGPIRVVALPNRKALLLGNSASVLFDGNSDTLTVLPDLKVRRTGYAATLLPNADVLVAGGWSTVNEDAAPTTTTLLIDPAIGAARNGSPLLMPRASPGAALLTNGQLMLFGGLSSIYYRYEVIGGPNYAEYTRSVETYAWEPEFSGRLPAGSYTATVTQPALADGGFWGIEAQTSGALDGGVNFGGMLQRNGDEPGFGAFFLPSAQTATVRVNLQYGQPAGGAGPPAATLRILDATGAAVAGPFAVESSGEVSVPLPSGFHVVELRSVSFLDMSFQASVSAAQLSSGASVGGLIQRRFGVTGFVNFYLASEQDVRLRLSNRDTYGTDRGAGEVILTLLDSTGRVVARVGPGATAPTP